MDIQNEELKNIILYALDEIDFEDINEDRLEEIEEIYLNAYLLNGKQTGITIEDVLKFPNLRELKLGNFNITENDVETIAKLEKLEELEIFDCKFTDVDFDKIAKKVQRLIFSKCKEMNFKYPNVKEIIIRNSKVDFDNLNFECAKRVEIILSRIKNVVDLTEFKNIEEVNLDGSILYDEKYVTKDDIEVSKNTIYTHKSDIELYD